MRRAGALLLDWLRLARSARARPFLLVTLFVDGAFIFVFLVAIQEYLPQQHGGGAALPGFALAGYGAAKLAAQLLGGRLIDRVGGGAGALIGMTLIVVGQGALLTGALLPPAVIGAAAVYGLGAAVLWPAIYALAISSFQPDEQARITSALTLTTGFALMGGLGLGLALPAGFPYAGATLIALVVVLLAFLAAAPLRKLGGKEASVERRSGASVGEVLRSALHPRRLAFATVVLLQSSAVGALVAVFRAYGREVLGVSFREELLLLAPAAVIGAVAVVVGGVLGDRVGRLAPLGLGFFVSGAAIWMLAPVTTPVLMVPLSVIGGLGYGLGLPSVGAMSMDLARTAGRGTLLAWFMTVEGLGHAFGPAVAGALLKTGAEVEVVVRMVGSLFAVVALVVVGVWFMGSRAADPAGEDDAVGEDGVRLALVEDGS